MQIIQNENLKPFNTFGLEATSKGVIHILHENDLFEVLLQGLSPLKILGGGSNVLITKNIEAYILRNEIKGIEIIDEDENQILVQCGAGEQWHQFVMWSLSHGLAGLENLSLIPGSVGAAPMQNIGAYGVEQESAFHSLKAIDLSSGVRRIFYKAECKFGYRESIFKNEVKDQYFITHVTYLLKKKDFQLQLSYGAITDILHQKGITQPTVIDVSEAVMDIRRSKLPDPKIIGNAGSFFKNPVISISLYDKLIAQYPDMPSYPINAEFVKIPAGWLIEKSGMKGYTKGHIGVHKLQALVLVNYGGGIGADIYQLALDIQQKVNDMFEIEITPEVNLW